MYKKWRNIFLGELPQSLRDIVNNNEAISEEFTSLPALSIVMIGFSVFLLLMANTYSAYVSRIESLDKYQAANFLKTKLTNPDCFFIKEGGLVDLSTLDDTSTSDTKINELRKKYRGQGIDFILQVSYQDIQKRYPSNADGLLIQSGDRVASSKSIGIYINPAQTFAGQLTVITWEVS